MYAIPTEQVKVKSLSIVSIVAFQLIFISSWPTNNKLTFGMMTVAAATVAYHRHHHHHGGCQSASSSFYTQTVSEANDLLYCLLPQSAV